MQNMRIIKIHNNMIKNKETGDILVSLISIKAFINSKIKENNHENNPSSK